MKDYKTVNVVGVEMYYRNNSTNNPTLIHFTKENGATYCGFEHWAAEHITGDITDHVIETACCKKCLKHIIS